MVDGAGLTMVTIERPRNHSKTGLFVAWGVTLFATLALGLVIAAAPLPYLAESASSPAVAAAP
jgi:hypothetical protein